MAFQVPKSPFPQPPRAVVQDPEAAAKFLLIVPVKEAGWPCSVSWKAKVLPWSVPDNGVVVVHAPVKLSTPLTVLLDWTRAPFPVPVLPINFCEVTKNRQLPVILELGVPPQPVVTTANVTRIRVNAFIFGMILVLCT